MKADTDILACNARALILSQSSSLQGGEYLSCLVPSPHGSVSDVFTRQRTSRASSTDMPRSGAGTIKRVTTLTVAER